MSDAPQLYRVDRLELSFSPKPWTFAIERQPEIEAYFAALQAENPALWNGRVLMLHRYEMTDDVFRGAYLETDYASFAAWIHWDRPQAGVYDCFGAAAVLAADGAFLLGVMGEGTLNAGNIYFPCGTPDPGDIVDGRVDLDYSVRRELKEETGLDEVEFSAEPGWTAVVDGGLIALIKVLRSHESAATLYGRVTEYLGREQEPELAGIRIVRGPADFDPMMRQFVKDFLAHRFAAG